MTRGFNIIDYDPHTGAPIYACKIDVGMVRGRRIYTTQRHTTLVSALRELKDSGYKVGKMRRRLPAGTYVQAKFQGGKGKGTITVVK